MAETQAMPELKQLLGALIFGVDYPLSVKEMRRCLAEVAQTEGGAAAAFAEVKESDLRVALADLSEELRRARSGFAVAEVAGGFRLESDPACGKWLRHLLARGKANRLSRPGLETLAIIAYRQPIARGEIEGIRGVNVDHMLRVLMEMQLVRIVGRSDLPGRPLLYGTTHRFLEHFGLKDLKDLEDLEPMLGAWRSAKAGKPPAPAQAAAGAAAGAAVSAAAKEDVAGGEEDEDEDADEAEEEKEDVPEAETGKPGDGPPAGSSA